MIIRIQRIVRKAIKDYQIQSGVSEETLVAFLSVDILRELNTMEFAPAPQPVKTSIKSKKEEGKSNDTTENQAQSAR
ncbi:hypothetical protein SBF1_5000008 [Candidatus Desulfosporosinus infrequens]|uniref:Uncharacterized protein n=1 Tax=Candidatus Desulfosporosinus infrequens TaxID=2043169 RepID=A0A2U3LHK4_9FIRM|nr:hypothetical protein SBF1_5000008 [Candidatus Desulfosporosinus infrequens]